MSFTRLKTSLKKEWDARLALRFLLVGGWNTLVGYALFVVLYGLLHRRVHVMLIGALAQILAIAHAYWCQRVLVFRSTNAIAGELTRFVVANGLTFVVTVGGLGAAVAWLHANPLLAQAASTVIAVAIAFLAHRHFSFAPAKT